MKRLFWLAVFAAIAWYGWQHRDLLLHRGPASEVVITNGATHAIERVRLTVDGETYVREVIEPGASSSIPVHVSRHTDFHLVWQWRSREGAPQWRGGEADPSDRGTRCVLEVFDDGDVTVSCGPAGPPAAAPR